MGGLRTVQQGDYSPAAVVHRARCNVEEEYTEWRRALRRLHPCFAGSKVDGVAPAELSAVLGRKCGNRVRSADLIRPPSTPATPTVGVSRRHTHCLDTARDCLASPGTATVCRQRDPNMPHCCAIQPT